MRLGDGMGLDGTLLELLLLDEELLLLLLPLLLTLRRRRPLGLSRLAALALAGDPGKGTPSFSARSLRASIER